MTTIDRNIVRSQITTTPDQSKLLEHDEAFNRVAPRLVKDAMAVDWREGCKVVKRRNGCFDVEAPGSAGKNLVWVLSKRNGQWMDSVVNSCVGLFPKESEARAALAKAPLYPGAVPSPTGDLGDGLMLEPRTPCHGSDELASEGTPPDWKARAEQSDRLYEVGLQERMQLEDRVKGIGEVVAMKDQHIKSLETELANLTMRLASIRDAGRIANASHPAMGAPAMVHLSLWVTVPEVIAPDTAIDVSRKFVADALRFAAGPGYIVPTEGEINYVDWQYE